MPRNKHNDVPQGPTRMRVILIDANGQEIATTDLPIVVDSPELREAIATLTDAVNKIGEKLELLTS